MTGYVLRAILTTSNRRDDGGRIAASRDSLAFFVRTPCGSRWF